MNESEVAAIVMVLRDAGVQCATPKSFEMLAKILSLACGYGAGDALDGYILQNFQPATLEKACDLLQVPQVAWLGLGPTSALKLLSAKSANPKISALLALLDRAATSGTSTRIEDIRALVTAQGSTPKAQG